ncbi:MAG: hypothetical protein D3904_03025 [Candidatus Electrothrix sp. EH2]|nr:hypothetical protein [Candidatus Electrothrix sp. EH2]
MISAYIEYFCKEKRKFYYIGLLARKRECCVLKINILFSGGKEKDNCKQKDHADKAHAQGEEHQDEMERRYALFCRRYVFLFFVQHKKTPPYKPTIRKQ